VPSLQGLVFWVYAAASYDDNDTKNDTSYSIVLKSMFDGTLPGRCNLILLPLFDCLSLACQEKKRI